jgi:hypothetical protein
LFCNIGLSSRPAVYVVVQNMVKTPDHEHYAKTFPKKVVTVLASLQLSICALSIIAQVVLINNEYLAEFNPTSSEFTTTTPVF